MTILKIKSNTAAAKAFLQYAETLSFVIVEEDKGEKPFSKAKF